MQFAPFPCHSQGSRRSSLTFQTSTPVSQPLLSPIPFQLISILTASFYPPTADTQPCFLALLQHSLTNCVTDGRDIRWKIPTFKTHLIFNSFEQQNNRIFSIPQGRTRSFSCDLKEGTLSSLERHFQSRMILFCLIHSFILFLPLVVWKAYNQTPFLFTLFGYFVPPSFLLPCPFCHQIATMGEMKKHREHTLKGSANAVRKQQKKNSQAGLRMFYYLYILFFFCSL